VFYEFRLGNKCMFTFFKKAFIKLFMQLLKLIVIRDPQQAYKASKHNTKTYIRRTERILRN
jgi:hypothetical protein